MISKLLLTFSFALIFVCNAIAQDPIFSQFYAAPMQVNPAFAGNSFAPRVTFNHRSQWPTINTGVTYSTYAASYDQFFDRANSGIGLFVLTDDSGSGILKTTKMSGLYSYRVKLSKDWYTKIGVEASYVQSRLDWNRLQFSDQFDRETGLRTSGGSIVPTMEQQPDNLNREYFDLSTGIVFYSPKYYAGLSLKHINSPSNSFLGINENLTGGIPMRFTFHAGGQFDIIPATRSREGIFVSPNILYVNQAAFNQVNAGAYVGFGTLFGGAWLRHTFGNTDAVIGLVGVKVKQFKIGYSFDMTISDLGLTNTGGSHEVSLSIDFNRKQAVDYNDCFSLFR